MTTKHHIDKRARQLADAIVGEPDQLMTTRELALFLGVSMQFLDIGRSKGYGPKFQAISPRCVRYRRSDVLKWLNARTYSCSADYTKRRSA
jgi:predicted DNA-binding transcriptional regulator AlpA